jgi:hypothetical protein
MSFNQDSTAALLRLLHSNTNLEIVHLTKSELEDGCQEKLNNEKPNRKLKILIHKNAPQRIACPKEFHSVPPNLPYTPREWHELVTFNEDLGNDDANFLFF